MCNHLLSVARPTLTSSPSHTAQVLRALREALLHDAGGAFLTPPRFRRLLPALVAQLGAEPDLAGHPRLGPALEADLAATAPEPALPALPAPPGGDDRDGGDAADGEQGDHAYGRSAVAAVVQLAVAGGSDDLWKPLNHQVLGAAGRFVL